MKTEQEINDLLTVIGISRDDTLSAMDTVKKLLLSDEERARLYIQFLEEALHPDELKNIRRASGFKEE